MFSSFDADPADEYFINLRILHIEDEKRVAHTVRRFLTTVSYADVEVQWAETLSEGLSQIRVGTWDCILLDLNLPDCYGIETFRQVHAFTNIPIIVLTAEDNLKKRSDVIAAGAQDCIYKLELLPDMLIRSIRFAVERQRTVQELNVALRELSFANEAMRNLLEEHGEDYVDSAGIPQKLMALISESGPKISTSNDVLNNLMTNPKIDTIEYRGLLNSSVHEITLRSSKSLKQYGVFVIGIESLKTLQNFLSRTFQFVEVAAKSW